MVDARTRTPDPDDATLVARAMAGERGAFAQLYDRHSAPLFRTALAVTRERTAADEILQEAFLRAFRHLARIRLESGTSLRPWLHRIVINLAYDWLARRRRAGSPVEGASESLVASGPSPERSAERLEESTAIEEAIDALPFKHRIVVILYYVHDMELVDIAAVLGLPEGTVKSRLYYGRAKLRAALAADRRLATHGAIGYARAASATG